MAALNYSVFNMFKFLKEIADSIKEGIEEAKQELAEEQSERDSNIKENFVDPIQFIKQISHEEKFGLALGAPFRVVIFGDWFSIFGNSIEDDAYPLHLYQFGEYPNKAEYLADLGMVLERDFLITDGNSCLQNVACFFELAGLDRCGTVLEVVDAQAAYGLFEPLWDTDQEGVNALLCATMSHIISASTDCDLLEKSAALILMQRVSELAERHYVSWDDYATGFLLGDKNIGLNNKRGRKYLTKYLAYLKDKKGSPWNNVEWVQNL